MTHVALLRGINVTGKNSLPMKELAQMFSATGCAKVRTYIQSGNVIFEAPGEAAKIAQVVTDTRDPEKRYMPGHPDADQDGYVAMPRMNPAEDMVDLLSAQRGFEGNVAAMSAIKDMIQHSIDLLR